MPLSVQLIRLTYFGIESHLRSPWDSGFSPPRSRILEVLNIGTPSNGTGRNDESAVWPGDLPTASGIGDRAIISRPRRETSSSRGTGLVWTEETASTRHGLMMR